jgi:hypothetical protein
VDLDSLMLVSGVYLLVWLMCAYLTLSCWSHCIWWGMSGAMEMAFSVFAFTFTSKSNSREELPFISELFMGRLLISLFRVYFRPKFTSSATFLGCSWTGGCCLFICCGG